MTQQRRDALRARRALSADDRASASEVICKRVIDSREFRSSALIACFLPLADEVDTREIIARAWRANKRIFVPVLRRNRQMAFCRLTPDTEIRRGDFGIWEPLHGQSINPRLLDLVITPLVAFDANRNRIGMGGGYYDRHFAFLRNRKYWIRPKLVGVAFQCQKVEKITPNPWDIRLYRIATEQ